MIKVVSVLQRKRGMAPETYQDYWLNVHADIVCRLSGIKRYVQSHTRLNGYKKHDPVADGIAELWFEDTDALRGLQGTAALAAVAADHVEFVAVDGHIQIVTEEHVIRDGALPDKAVKNVELVKKKADQDVGAFQQYWRNSHGPLAGSIGQIIRYVQSHTRAAAYRHAPPALDGVALTWFESTDAMRASAETSEYAKTRADEHNFLAVPLDFIVTEEHVIIS